MSIEEDELFRGQLEINEAIALRVMGWIPGKVEVSLPYKPTEWTWLDADGNRTEYVNSWMDYSGVEAWLPSTDLNHCRLAEVRMAAMGLLPEYITELSTKTGSIQSMVLAPASIRCEAMLEVVEKTNA